MKAIVAVDRNWGIGNKGDLLFHIKEDMQFFKKMTTGKVVVMGKNTFESLPNKEPLKDRLNLVITPDGYEKHNNLIFGSMEEIMQEAKGYDTSDVFVIGGGSIYEQLVPYCNIIYVTRIDASKEADTFFPDLSQKGFILEKTLYTGKTEDGVFWSIEKWIGCF
jgi:dihydrofolate reductase